MYEPKGIVGEGKTFSPSKKLSLTEVRVEEFQLEGMEIEDITIEPPRYRKPVLSMKKSGIVKFGIGLIRELQDRGGFLWIGRLYVIDGKLIIQLLDEARSHQLDYVREIPLGVWKYKTYEKDDKEQGHVAGTWVRDDNGDLISVLEPIRVGEVHLGRYLVRAELSDDNNLEQGDLIPTLGYTSRDFGLDGMSFDTTQVVKGTLLLSIDPSKGVNFRKERGGKIIPHSPPTQKEIDILESEMDTGPSNKEVLPREYEFDEHGNKTDVTIDIPKEDDIDKLEREMDEEDAKS